MVADPDRTSADEIMLAALFESSFYGRQFGEFVWNNADVVQSQTTCQGGGWQYGTAPASNRAS